ncbi:DUF5753 domain-containing protein [Streptomyces niveus]|uniref:DUF5753 domain-containing protein n=1 Tax=Streptomyces niveus TaxID=193462 RepID=UPI00343D154B
MELLKNANQRPWWQDWSDVTARHLQTFVSFEATARRICTYEPRHLPTLLQTGEYARALSGARMPEATPSEVERLVEFHQKRVQRFEGSAEKKLICVIDELTLVRPYGDSGVMRRQIDRLIALADNPQFVMRIAELSRPNLPVMLGSTTLFEFDDKLLPEIVYAEHFDDASILQEAGQVHKWIKHFDRLRQVSLSREQSVHHLCKLREMLE